MNIPESDKEVLWELFHENSKSGRHDYFISREELREKMLDLIISESFDEYPSYQLPDITHLLTQPMGDIMQKRRSARALEYTDMTLEQLSALLYYSYGVTLDNEGTEFPHPFRIIPSAGGLFPLEVYFHTTAIEGLPSGLYHYSSATHSIQLLRESNETNTIAEFLVQPEVAESASVMFFITAVFDRSVFKYGDRGYRFVMIEAGHLAQNMNLAATSMGLSSLNMGGFFDREADEFLGLDGVERSSIYMVAVGK